MHFTPSSRRLALRTLGAKVCLRAIASLSLWVAASAHAEPTTTRVWFGQVSQGQPSEAAPVRSWTAMKFDNVVRQQTDFSCGAAVLATILNFAFGYHATEKQMLVNMFKVADPDVVRDKGFSLLDMKNYTLAIGLQGQGYKVAFDALTQLKVPAVALINIRGYKHFVIVRKATNEAVSIGDPALGNRVMSRKAFEQVWNGVLFVVTGQGYNADTVLMHPPRPLSAGELFKSRSAITNADTAEFGFGPSFNFTL